MSLWGGGKKRSEECKLGWKHRCEILQPSNFLFADARSLASRRELRAPPENIMPDTCRRETITVMSLMSTKRESALPVGSVCWHRPQSSGLVLSMTG